MSICTHSDLTNKKQLEHKWTHRISSLQPNWIDKRRLRDKSNIPADNPALSTPEAAEFATAS